MPRRGDSSMNGMMMRCWLAVAVACASVAGCQNEGAAAADEALAAAKDEALGATGNPAATAVSATATATRASGDRFAASARGQVRSNYDASKLAPDPRAVELCEVLHQRPAERKAECVGAKSTGITATPLCVDTLTAALKIGKISIDAAAVERCAQAMKAATQECDFAKSFALPLPAACDPLIDGTLARGAACRSSLECAAGLQCFGVGPSDVGRCTPPAPRGSMCGTGVDALAVYARQSSTERTRPACEGYCRLNRCQDFHALGAECQATMQCGPGASCQKSKCTKA